MRKALVVLVFSVLLALLAAGPVLAGIVVRIGVDSSGRLEEKGFEKGESYHAKRDTEIGFSVAGEYLFAASKDLDFGAGFEYQSGRRPEGYQKRFHFTPVYVLCRYRFSSFYLTAKTGYSPFQLEDAPENSIVKGGLFYGAGFGIFLTDGLHVELLYSLCSAKARVKGVPESLYKADIKYTRIGLSVGYEF